MGRPDKIGQLLAGSYIDPDSRKPVRVETKSLIILPTLKGAESQAVKDLGFGRRLAVVSDVTTHEVLGQRVEGSLARALRRDQHRAAAKSLSRWRDRGKNPPRHRQVRCGDRRWFRHHQ